MFEIILIALFIVLDFIYEFASLLTWFVLLAVLFDVDFDE